MGDFGVIENEVGGIQTPRKLGRAELVWCLFMQHVWHLRLKRWIPRLVWLNDEIDVVVTLQEHKLSGAQDDSVLWEVEDRLRRMGLRFDTGMGLEGRDWEWDWSLSGPVSVRFRGRAKRPDLRIKRERRPALRIVNASATADSPSDKSEGVNKESSDG
jgi:hypothetical protein